MLKQKLITAPANDIDREVAYYTKDGWKIVSVNMCAGDSAFGAMRGVVVCAVLEKDDSK